MTDDEEATDGELWLVARNGSGPFIRALAVAQLARRHDAVDEVQKLIDADADRDEGGGTTA